MDAPVHPQHSRGKAWRGGGGSGKEQQQEEEGEQEVQSSSVAPGCTERDGAHPEDIAHPFHQR